MRKIIIGSHAAKKYNLSRGDPKDMDVWVERKISPQKGLDQKVIPKEILDLVDTDSEGYTLPDSLFTIKCSHLGWDNPMWKKHYLDVLFMKQKGCLIKENLFEKLIEHWKKEFGNKEFLSLKKDKETFFTDNVNYVIDHDLLHEKAALPNRPIYEKCLKLGEDVLIDKDKFDKMSFDDKVRMLQEEIHVILFERWIIPARLRGDKSVSWLKCYPWSVRKTITSLTKNEFTEFIIRNIDKFYKPNIDIINNLNNFLEEEGI